MYKNFPFNIYLSNISEDVLSIKNIDNIIIKINYDCSYLKIKDYYGTLNSILQILNKKIFNNLSLLSIGKTKLSIFPIKLNFKVDKFINFKKINQISFQTNDNNYIEINKNKIDIIIEEPLFDHVIMNLINDIIITYYD